MTPMILALCVALAARAIARRRTRRDRYDALGAMHPDWRPVGRTVVRTHHLTGGRSS